MPASETTVGPRGSVSSLMAGKRGLVMGVANDHSIAWGVAKTLHEHGAELAFTYQGENFGRRVKPLADSVGAELLLPAVSSRRCAAYARSKSASHVPVGKPPRPKMRSCITGVWKAPHEVIFAIFSICVGISSMDISRHSLRRTRSCSARSV